MAATLLFAAFLGHSTAGFAQAAPAVHHLVIGVEAEPAEDSLKTSHGSMRYLGQLIDPLLAWFNGNLVYYSGECKAVRGTITAQELALIQSFLEKKEKRELYKRLFRALSAYIYSGESSSDQKLAVRPFVEKFLAYYAACEKLEGDSLKAYEILQNNFKDCDA